MFNQCFGIPMNSLRQLKRIFCPIQEPHLNIPSYWQNLNVSWQLQGPQGGISVQLQVKTTGTGCGLKGPNSFYENCFRTGWRRTTAETSLVIKFWCCKWLFYWACLIAITWSMNYQLVGSRALHRAYSLGIQCQRIYCECNHMCTICITFYGFVWFFMHALIRD